MVVQTLSTTSVSVCPNRVNSIVWFLIIAAACSFLTIISETFQAVEVCSSMSDIVTKEYRRAIRLAKLFGFALVAATIGIALYWKLALVAFIYTALIVTMDCLGSLVHRINKRQTTRHYDALDQFIKASANQRSHLMAYPVLRPWFETFHDLLRRAQSHAIRNTNRFSLVLGLDVAAAYGVLAMLIWLLTVILLQGEKLNTGGIMAVFNGFTCVILSLMTLKLEGIGIHDLKSLFSKYSPTRGRKNSLDNRVNHFLPAYPKKRSRSVSTYTSLNHDKPATFRVVWAFFKITFTLIAKQPLLILLLVSGLALAFVSGFTLASVAVTFGGIVELVLSTSLDSVRKTGTMWSLITFIVAAVGGITMYLSQLAFGVFGEKLIGSVMQKDYERVIIDLSNGLQPKLNAFQMFMHGRAALYVSFGGIWRAISMIVSGIMIAIAYNWLMVVILAAVIPALGLVDFILYLINKRQKCSKLILGISILCRAIKPFLIVASQAMSLHYGALLIAKKELTLKSFFNVYIAMTVIAFGAYYLQQSISEFVETLLEVARNLRLDNRMRITYRASEPVVKVFSLNIKNWIDCYNNSMNASVHVNELLRIGSSSSDIIASLLGLSSTTNGTIEVEYEKGILAITSDLITLPRRFLAGSVSFVPRHPFLFQERSIAENIALSIADEASIISVGNMVGLDAFVMSLPHGYRTFISEAKCGDLECFQIGLARAMLSDSSILLLEEGHAKEEEEEEEEQEEEASIWGVFEGALKQAAETGRRFLVLVSLDFSSCE